MVPPAKGDEQEVANPVTGEIVKSEKRPFTDAELRNIESMDALGALLGEGVSNAEDLGSGFALLSEDQKSRLVGVPLVFVFWTFNPTDVGERGEFVSAHVVQMGGQGKIVGKFIVNDGSTGIYRQLRDFTDDKGRQQGLAAPKGLRRSDYTFTDTDGKDKPATTYYIDTSAVA